MKLDPYFGIIKVLTRIKTIGESSNVIIICIPKSVKRLLARQERSCKDFVFQIRGKVARDSGAVVRDRKLKVNKFVFAVLTILGASPKTQNLTMKSVYSVYNRLANLGERLSAKCMHKHLDSDKMTECMKALLESISSAIAGLTQKKYKSIVPKAVRRLMRRLNVKDIILIDGTEIDARLSPAKHEEFQGSGKGRPHLDGEPSMPGIKLHAAYSVAGQNFVCIDGHRRPRKRARARADGQVSPTAAMSVSNLKRKSANLTTAS